MNSENVSNETEKPALNKGVVSSRFFFFVYSFWGDTAHEGKGNASFISNYFPKKEDVITVCKTQVQKNYNNRFTNVSIVIENWIEMSKEDYDRFVS